MNAADSAIVTPSTSRQGTNSGVSFGKKFQRWIITIHRWIGIGVCVMVMVWFLSGLVLAYVPFPKMSAEEKLRYLQPLEWSRVEVSPGAAIASAGIDEFPKELRLEMSGKRPVYRITDWKRHNITVAADSGEVLGRRSPEQALAIVRQQLSAPGAAIRAANVDSDQWTMTGYWNRERPFHIIDLNDSAGSRYYVSVASGEVLMGTRRTQRILNWLGAIPHWLYFEGLRRYTHEGIWTWTIYIVAGASILVSISGLWIGISRMRLRMRYTDGSWTPFRGWMKWHHVTGILGGVFLALWIISGFFTMYPGGFLEQREMQKSDFIRYAGSQNPSFTFSALSALAAENIQATRATFRYVGGRPLVALERTGVAPRVIDPGTGADAPVTLAQITVAARALLPGAKIIGTRYLEHGDEYWHSAYQHKKTPIARVIFDDAQATWFHIDPQTGEVLDLLNNTGRVNRWTVVAIHDVDLNWLLTRRPLWDVMLFALSIPGILISLSTLVISYRRLQRTNLVPAFAGGGFHGGGSASGLEERTRAGRRIAQCADAILVAFASQTGTAEILANKTADSFRAAGARATVSNLADLQPSDLAGTPQAILVVSTTGDGDAPDQCIPFQRRVLRMRPDLQGLQFGLLALGDRQYSRFCGFGVAIDNWLSDCGARRLFPAVLVDERDPEGLALWSREIGVQTGRTEDFSLTEEPFRPWRLVKRALSNSGSVGDEAFYFEFASDGELSAWEAGDIAQIAAGQSWQEFRARQHRLIQREFSIASTPQSARIQLLIRRVHTLDGRPGVASGYLIESLALGDSIPLRIRRNANFHGPADDRPVLLIGNGTGIAGLRAHLQRRVELGHRRNWLCFGERSAAHDRFYSDDLHTWQEQGFLERLDLVFSRDQARRVYVQERLMQRRREIQQWVASGASIYICGSLRGMAPGVNECLVSILGQDVLESMARSGRYLRDVY